ncbi:unnamed protein product, partial [Allacma fusca]
WFAIFYLVFAFCILPLIVFALSMIGAIAFYCVISVAGVIILLTTVLNLLQDYAPEQLPEVFRNWNFLPLYLHSLEPCDKLVQKALDLARQTCCGSCCAAASQESNEIMTMPSQSSSVGLDNLGFIRGDHSEETGNNCGSSNVGSINKIQKKDQNIEQTQL